MAAEDLEWERSKISNQDLNMMKKLGLMKKEDAIRFPSEESYPNPPMEYRVSFVDHLIRGLSAPIHDFLRGLLFFYGIQLHHLTPNSILHISIFITLCECFLGVPPNWALWKRIFLLRRNASRNATYNIGGVVICVRTDVDYFDVKFPDSVQGWRKKWLYIHEESANSVEHNIIPFDGNAKIQRRRSWDAEASEEEKKATEALMSRMHQLQNTRGKELSGVQITAYFLRIRVQPLHARKNPLWTYAGGNDANRLSSDLSAKDLEKLIRRISRLNKKDPVPSSCRVEPYSSTNPLPEPMIKDFIRIGSQFIGYREYASKAEEANNRADALVQKLEQSEAARKKAELVASEAKAEADEAKAKAASVEELQKRLEDAESALNEHKTAQAAREEGILKRLKSQIRRTETQTNQGFDLKNPVNDPLLDTLSYLELHGSEIREGVSNASTGLSTLFPYFFPKKEEPPTFLALKLQFIDLTEELKELRVQLQSVKKQSLMLMEQSRGSSQREKIALQQAQDAMTEKDTAVAEAAAATSRENSMLQLLTDASLDMAGFGSAIPRLLVFDSVCSSFDYFCDDVGSKPW
ncbi:hypothetical protein QYE76_071555 [Lolium multiflorum]|uniref:Transposase (putative) gypsy type domain-containing protein n=1 Tax=Lolium multiflorum TaxID=4521 RepID=A0AAD8WFI2_LOLMU|nr:hypothetical protein QYE76_071555 [Lolium multiflorum]